MYGPIGLIKAIVETVLDALPFRASSRGADAPAQAMDELRGDDPSKNYPEWFWEGALRERVIEREKADEQVTGMILEDYESRHEEQASPEYDIPECPSEYPGFQEGNDSDSGSGEGGCEYIG